MSRRKALLTIVEELQKKYAATDSAVKDLVAEEDHVQFNVVYKDKSDFYSIITSEYPEYCMVCSPNSDEPAYCEDKLDKIVDDAFKESYVRWGVIKATGNEKPKESTPKKVLGVSSNSVGSAVSDDHDAMEEEDLNAFKKNQDLMQDLRNFAVTFGEENIKYHYMPLLEVVDVELRMDPKEILSTNACEGWKIDPWLPIVIKLHINDKHYLEPNFVPQIEVWQLEDFTRHKFGIKYQLDNIMNTFVKKELTHGFQRPNAKPANTQSQPRPSTIVTSKDDKAKDQNKKQDVSMDIVISLVQMGFAEEAAFNAVRDTGNSFDEALDLLSDNPFYEGGYTKKSNNNNKNNKNNKQADDDPRKTHKFWNDPKNLGIVEKGAVNRDMGFFVMLMVHMRSRIPKLNEYCVICDENHLFGSNMLKPAVCTRDLCCWSFQQLKVGSEAAEDIATDAEVVDLLVSMTINAVKSNRNNVIFSPFPTVFDPDHPDRPVLSEERKDMALVQEILNRMPSVEEMTKAKDFGTLKEQIDRAHRLCFPLLQWIISSNRSHIIKIPEQYHIKLMQTPHQYLLASAPPEKEAKFQLLKKQHGSKFAFHGSPIENWHSILRVGLKNASGTKLQLNGAAYGSGIYMAANSSTSSGYSLRHMHQNPNNKAKSNNKFLTNSDVYCIALCEYVPTCKQDGEIVVHPDEDCVITRFFFVFTAASIPANSTRDQNFLNQINAALAYHQTNKD
jgi:poly [ADP-ribose] polymerase 6/8